MKTICFIFIVLLVSGCVSSLLAEKAVDSKPEKSAPADPSPAKAKPTAPKAGETRTFDGLEFVWIPAGEFLMGSPESEKGRYRDEGPVRTVRITKGFWLGKYEVTNAQYRRFKPNHSSSGFKGHSLNGDKQPVVKVSWEDAIAFCKDLTAKSSGGIKYRLPTEAEWEYACRAGSRTTYQWGDAPNEGKGWLNGVDLTAKDKFSDCPTFDFDDSYVVSAPVGSFRANAWGLHDMHGNVWEWCSDWYADDYYGTRSAPDSDPAGPESGFMRVDRGGGWDNSPAACRSADRGQSPTPARAVSLGLRVVAVPAAD